MPKFFVRMIQEDASGAEYIQTLEIEADSHADAEAIAWDSECGIVDQVWSAPLDDFV